MSKLKCLATGYTEGSSVNMNSGRANVWSVTRVDDNGEHPVATIFKEPQGPHIEYADGEETPENERAVNDIAEQMPNVHGLLIDL